jgi:hypothetical protein
MNVRKTLSKRKCKSNLKGCKILNDPPPKRNYKPHLITLGEECNAFAYVLGKSICFKGFEEFKFFIHRPYSKSDRLEFRWHISEALSGCCIAKRITMNATTTNAYENLQRAGLDEVRRCTAKFATQRAVNTSTREELPAFLASNDTEVRKLALKRLAEIQILESKRRKVKNVNECA